MLNKSQQRLRNPCLNSNMKIFHFLYSYCFEDERGIFPEVEFVYDLKLPADFQPRISDGEVEEFFCWPIEKVILDNPSARSIVTLPTHFAGVPLYHFYGRAHLQWKICFGLSVYGKVVKCYMLTNMFLYRKKAMLWDCFYLFY